MLRHPLNGIYVASLTPITPQLTPDLPSLGKLLEFYANRGCHGTLLLGTTGEGTSFGANERKAIWQEAIKIKQNYPDFKLLAGTGTPSLEDTIEYNKFVFDLGYDGVVVLPPYFLRNAADNGLFSWYQKVIQRSVPSNGNVLGYHIPQVSGVALSIDLLKKLRDHFPNQFVGLKDSTGDIDHAKMLIDELPESVILVGNDKLLLPSLKLGSSGCITAGANIISPILREIWDAFEVGKFAEDAHSKAESFRGLLDQHPPFPASLKKMMEKLFDFPEWELLPPLEKYTDSNLKDTLIKIKNLLS